MSIGGDFRGGSQSFERREMVGEVPAEKPRQTVALCRFRLPLWASFGHEADLPAAAFPV